MKKINNVIDWIFSTVGMILLIGIVISTFLQVITRYFLNNSLIGTEEVARYCFIWMGMVGGAIGVGKWSHSSVTVLYDLFHDKGKKLIFIALNLLIILCGSLFIYGGIQMVTATFSQLSPTLRIPKSLVYASLPIGGFGMIMHALQNILESIVDYISLSKSTRGMTENG